MDTIMVEGTISGRCHPFGVLHGHHYVCQPHIYTYGFKFSLRKADQLSLETGEIAQ